MSELLEAYRAEHPEYKNIPDSKLSDALYTNYYADKMSREDFNRRVSYEPGSKGATAAVQQGMTFGLADEAAAAGSATGAFLKNIFKGYEPAYKAAGEAYDRAMSGEKSQRERYAKENPITSGASELLGGVAGAVPGALRTIEGALTVARPTVEGAAPSAARQFGVNVGQGAGMGAVAGAGSADPGIENRIEGAVKGGVVGGTVGAALPLALTGIGKAVEVGKNALGLNDATKSAQALLLRAFERDGIPLQDATAKIQQWVAAGAKPETLMEIGGQNVRWLAKDAAATPSEFKQAASKLVEDRARGQNGRLLEDVERNISPVTDVSAEIDRLVASRKAAADPLYREAMDIGPVYNDKIGEFLQNPVVMQGLRKGLEAERLRSIARGEKFDPTDFAITGFNEAGDPILGKVPNMRLLDRVKKDIDETLNGFRDPITKKLPTNNDYVNALNEFRRSYLNQVDGLNPVYAEARKAFEDPSRLIEAMTDGQRIFNWKSELTAKRIADMTDAEREAFRAGVAQAIKDKIQNTKDGMNGLRSFFSSEAYRNKLRAAFPDQASFDQFVANMEREATITKVNRQIDPNAGSPTEPLRRAAEDSENSPAISGFFGQLAQGHGLLGALTGTAKGLWQRGQGMNKNTANALVDALLSTSPGQNAQTIQGLIGHDAATRAIAAKRAALMQALTGGVGAGSGALTE